MTAHDVLTDPALRSKLFAIAYRMLGSTAEAEDIVQDALLKLAAADGGAIDDLRAYLVRTVSNLSIDRLRALRVRREAYEGPWLPEPFETEVPSAEDTTELAESIKVAFLLVLERLSPDERAAFLLSEVFGLPSAEVAQTLGKSDAACRQLLHRARTRVAAERPAQRRPPTDGSAVFSAFLAACATGDAAQLARVLRPDVTATTDHGGKASAARRLLTGASTVARFVVGLMKKQAAVSSYRATYVNGEPAVVVSTDGVVDAVMILGVEGDQIGAVRMIRNPEKLRSFQSSGRASTK